MRQKLITAKAERAFIGVKNAEVSTVLTSGMPVCFNFSGTDDGFGVITPATGGAGRAHALFAGVVCQADNAINAGEFGEAQVAGVCEGVNLLLMTKAASTDIWASIAAIARGTPFVVDTINNCFSTVATVGVTAMVPYCAAAASRASTTTAASDAYSSAVALSATAYSLKSKAFLRAI